LSDERRESETTPAGSAERRRAVLIVDHGSRNARANAQLESLARRVAEQRPDWIVHFAHMEIAEPDIAAGLARCIEDGAAEIVVHPYFLGPGLHIQETVPEKVADAARAHPHVRITITAHFGAHDGVADLLIEHVESEASD